MAISKASEKLAAFVACREAIVTVAYTDGPHMSIGAGSNDPSLKEGDTITIEDAFKRLKKDIEIRESYISKNLKVEVSQNQFDAILDLYYQNANKRMGTKNVIAVVNSLTPEQLKEVKDPINTRLHRGEKLDVVSDELDNYCYNSSGNLILGLLTRRRMEIDMFWRNDYGDLSSILVFHGNPRVTKPISMPFDYKSFHS